MGKMHVEPIRISKIVKAVLGIFRYFCAFLGCHIRTLLAIFLGVLHPYAQTFFLG